MARCWDQVEKCLGKGTYGSVFRVKRLSDGRQYAMKQVRPCDPPLPTHADASSCANTLRDARAVDALLRGPFTTMPAASGRHQEDDEQRTQGTWALHITVLRASCA